MSELGSSTDLRPRPSFVFSSPRNGHQATTAACPFGAINGSRTRQTALLRKFREQRFRFLQIARVEPFSEPAVNRSQQFASLLQLPLIAPKPREACGGAKFQQERTLLLRKLQCDTKRPLNLLGRGSKT